MKFFIVCMVCLLCAKEGTCRSLLDDESLKQDELIPETVTPKVDKTTSTTMVNKAKTTESDATLSTESFSSSFAQKISESNASFVDRLSNQIRLILKHFQEPDPVGLPGEALLPEPMSAENVTASMVIATGDFYNISVYGLSNFTISVVDAHLDQMEVFVVVRLKNVYSLGNYTMSNLLVNSAGPFNITLYNVTVTGAVSLSTDEYGKLFANNSTIDMKYDFIQTELIDASSVVLPFVSSGGASVFEAEKPLILENINQRLLLELNQRLKGFPKIPALSKASPVDLAVAEGRKFVKYKYEPFNISKIFDFENSFLKVTVGPVFVYGLSKFARVGNVTLLMVNQTVELKIRLITGRLIGNCKWYYDIGKVGVTRDGQSNFSIDHLQFEAKLKQPVDSRKSPVLEELEIETGQIFVKMDGQGSFDYIVEIVVKLLPKMLRHMIIDALEEPIKMKVQQEVLSQINVERVYEENLPDIKNYLSDKM